MNDQLVVAEDTYLQENIEIIIGDLEQLLGTTSNLNHCREELEALVRDLRYVLVDEA